MIIITGSAAAAAESRRCHPRRRPRPARRRRSACRGNLKNKGPGLGFVLFLCSPCSESLPRLFIHWRIWCPTASESPGPLRQPECTHTALKLEELPGCLAAASLPVTVSVARGPGPRSQNANLKRGVGGRCHSGWQWAEGPRPQARLRVGTDSEPCGLSHREPSVLSLRA
jgi:hypothetical protein